MFGTNAHAYFTKKILHDKQFKNNLNKRKMEGATKERAIWYLKFCIKVVWGVKDPYNGLYASLLCFQHLNSQNLIRNVRKEMVNLPRIKRSSKQKQMVVLYKRLTALSSSNRRPRIFSTMYRARISRVQLYPFLSLWGCRKISSKLRIFFVNHSLCVSPKYLCGENMYCCYSFLLKCFPPKKVKTN